MPANPCKKTRFMMTAADKYALDPQCNATYLFGSSLVPDVRLVLYSGHVPPSHRS